MSSLRYFNIYMYFIYNICNCLCLLFSRMFEAFKYMSYLLFLISKQKPLYCLIKNNIFCDRSKTRNFKYIYLYTS